MYWKKRCSQRYVKVGEENSKFFQAMASERHRRNYIASLQLADGTPCSTHDLLANAFWSAFKNRMGVAKGIVMAYNLNALLSPVDGLEALVSPFDRKEMDDTIKFMPPNKSHGPDGFNGIFLKSWWSIICSDFYRLAEDFHSG